MEFAKYGEYEVSLLDYSTQMNRFITRRPSEKGERALQEFYDEMAPPGRVVWEEHCHLEPFPGQPVEVFRTCVREVVVGWFEQNQFTDVNVNVCEPQLVCIGQPEKGKTQVLQVTAKNLITNQTGYVGILFNKDGAAFKIQKPY